MEQRIRGKLMKALEEKNATHDLWVKYIYEEEMVVVKLYEDS